MNGGINRCGALTFDMTTGAIREADPEYEVLLAAAAQGSKRNLFSLVAPREQRRVLHSLREQGEKAGALREEFPVQMADGSMGWQLIYGRRNPANADLWDCIAFDCTSQVETEQELQRLREQMQLWVDNTPGGVVSYLYNGWFQVDFISEGMLRIIGCTREEFRLRYGNQFNRLIHPQDYERVTREVVEDNTPGKPKKLEYRILDYHGQVKWLFGNRQVIHDVDGNTRAYLVLSLIHI